MKLNRILLLLTMAASVILAACGGGDDSVSESIVLSQSKIESDINGTTVQIGVTANTAWNASVFDMQGSWVTVTPKSGTNNGSITVTVAANTGDARSATVKVFSKMADASVAITQAAAPKEEEPDDNPGEEPEVTVTPMAQVREMYKGASVKVDGDVVIEGVVVSNFRRDTDGGLNNYSTAKTIVVSDGNAGLQLYCSADNKDFARGDKVRVALKGLTLAVYANGALQVQGDNGTGMPLSAISKVGNETPQAKEISVADLVAGKYESMYVAVKEVQVVEEDLSKTFATADAHTSIGVEAKSGELFDIFTSKYATFKSQKVPQGSGTLKGIAGVYNGKTQIMISDVADYAGMSGARFESAAKFALQFTSKEILCNAGSFDVELVSTGAWKATSSNSEFTVSPASADEGKIVTISYSKNPSAAQERSAEITFEATGGAAAGKKVVLTIKQAKYEAMESDAVQGWIELPRVEAKEEFAFVTHRTAVKGSDARSFSYWYDGNNRVAHWVAYPIYKDIAEDNINRTDSWAYEPKLPQWCQPTLFKGWGVSGYDRGHQLPSQDRVCSVEANQQTFYFPNIIAQNSDLNQSVWGNLENKVRDWSKGCDTLYVVTGVVISTKESPAVEYIKDNEGKQVAKPKALFKVLLRYSKSSTENGGYSAIGFWYENKKPSSAAVTATNAKKVKDIETLTGFDFFHNLDDAVESKIEGVFAPGEWGL
ncbi:MAG: DNA/RNA non-specific endonuclease [Bacteroidales bacterium]|nr:DNA/RNA non-specific endonuclease [Bacteroidales bacterium]